MTDEEHGGRLIRDFAWWHWVLVGFGAFRGLSEAGLFGALAGAIALVLWIVLLRVVWKEVKLYHRRSVEDVRA